MDNRKKEIYVLGIGGSSFKMIDLANACGYEVIGLYHYNNERTGQIDHGYRILGSFDDLFEQDIKDKNFLLTMGDMNIRKSLSDKIILKGGRVPTLAHPSAEISQFALISPLGVIVDSQTVIQADCIIDEGVYICSHSMICHQTHLEAYVFVAPHALIGARLNIRDFVFVGQNATLISTKVKEIGSHTIVGAGAVVTKELPPHVVVVGNPARIIKSRD